MSWVDRLPLDVQAALHEGDHCEAGRRLSAHWSEAKHARRLTHLPEEGLTEVFLRIPKPEAVQP